MYILRGVMGMRVCSCIRCCPVGDDEVRSSVFTCVGGCDLTFATKLKGVFGRRK